MSLQEFWVRGQKFKQQYLDRFCNELNYKFVEASRYLFCVHMYLLVFMHVHELTSPQ